MDMVLCRITAKLSAELRSSESWFESGLISRFDVSPIVVVSSFTLAGNVLRTWRWWAFLALTF